MGGETIRTPLTERLGLQVPIMLAGMSGVSHGELAAAVSNAGGIGVIGGLTLSPKVLRKEIADLKANLRDKSLPFGVDLAWPKIGEGARKTNHDYTHGKMPELIDIIIEEGARIFVVAVGVPEKWAVDKLHAAGILVANMVGSPRNAEKALASGADVLIAQGTEGGGHTGEIGTMALIPQVLETANGHRSKMDGSPILVVAAGGIVNGKGVAAALSLGASGVWVGTRFVASLESHASQRHKESIVRAGALDTTRSLIYSGRPLRTLVTDYVREWHEKRQREIEELCDKGVVPYMHDLEVKQEKGEPISIAATFPQLMGQGVGAIHDIKPAGEIVQEMMDEAISTLRANAGLISKL